MGAILLHLFLHNLKAKNVTAPRARRDASVTHIMHPKVNWKPLEEPFSIPLTPEPVDVAGDDDDDADDADDEGDGESEEEKSKVGEEVVDGKFSGEVTLVPMSTLIDEPKVRPFGVEYLKCVAGARLSQAASEEEEEEEEEEEGEEEEEEKENEEEKEEGEEKEEDATFFPTSSLGES